MERGSNFTDQINFEAVFHYCTIIQDVHIVLYPFIEYNTVGEVGTAATSPF